MTPTPRRRVAALAFDRFELLDLFGPLEFFGMDKAAFEILIVGATDAPIQSAQGPRIVADAVFDAIDGCDILLVPGGSGTRSGVDDPTLIDTIARLASKAEIVASVCTGAALLAKAGLLSGRAATTNKNAFDWVATQGPEVDWRRRARWVEDGRFVTSSGVSAGMDMTLAVIARLLGDQAAADAARWAEYVPNLDPANDPFDVTAALQGN